VASIAGSQFVFGAAETVKLVYNPSGDPANLPPPIGGDFNLELTTHSVGGIPTGYAGVAMVTPESATGPNTLNMLFGDYGVTDTASGDTINAGSGNDTINTLAHGGDVVQLSTGAASVYGGVGDSITGGSGSAYIDGTKGTMSIAAGTGGSELIFSGSGDTITGGGANLAIVGATGDRIDLTLQTGNATVNALAGGETVTLGNGPGLSVVFAGSGDTITAGSGPAYIDAGLGGSAITVGGAGGADTIFGGVGDTIVGGAATAVVVMASGESLDFTGQSGNATVGAFGNDTVTLGASAASVWGGVGDSIVAGTGLQLIDGSPGSMSIAIGAASTDLIFGGVGDTITGGAANTVLVLASGENVDLSAQTGAATIGAFSNNAVTLGGGAASVWGGVGDQIFAGTGNAYIDGTNGGMTITGGSAGTDTIYGSLGGTGDSIVGGAGNMVVIGRSGDTVSLASGNASVNALGGNQFVTFGSGGDTVFGGAGDTITGGSGINQYIDFSQSTNAGGSRAAGEFLRDDTTQPAGFAGGFDTVFNFDTGAGAANVGDRIIGDSASQQTVIMLTAADDAQGNANITLTDGTNITFHGISTAQLTALNTAGHLFG
jgi:hypothetical protein